MDMFMGGRRVTFEPPGPGSWQLDPVHFARPVSRFQAEIHPPNLSIGFRESFARYGLLVETLRYAFVHGFAYSAPVPAPEAEIPARFAAAAQAFETRLWRADLARWEQETKPAAIRSQRALQAVDPAALDDDALLAHLDRCRDNLARMVQQHHRFNAAALLPVGDLIAHLREWTGRPIGEILSLLRGSAPESAGRSAELDALVAAIRMASAAAALLGSATAPGEILAGLRGMDGGVGAAAGAYLDLVGYRLLDSFDTADAYALEVPEVLVKGLRLAVEGGAAAPREATAAEQARLRDMVPAAQRANFDDLLAEARHLSRLRDERGLYSDVWAGGICRRAVLEAGARAVARGALEVPVHLAECDYAEMLAVLGGRGGPTAATLAERRRFRDTYNASDAPPFLGEPPHPPPSPDGLPPGPRRAMRAVGAAIEALFAPSTATSEATVVRGIGASPGVYTGTARVIGTPAEFGRLQRGDVLVTATTTESFNVVLPVLGAIVTDAGGLLSHAAIVSREYGIPGVVGCRDATRRIADGATVRVDGVTGEVTLLAR